MTEQKSLSAQHPRFFRHEANERYIGGWYWIDDACEEPMGPFASMAEAKDDYRECRLSQQDEVLYRFHWRDGRVTEARGMDGAAAAMNALGYGRGALAALDYYEVLPLPQQDTAESQQDGAAK